MTDSPITLEIVEGPNEARDDSGWDHYAYVVMLRRGDTLGEDGDTMTVPWKQGLGLTSDPEAHEVLESLLSDAATVENVETFEDWANELGYDPDSRSAEAIYREVETQAAKLRAFLGDDYDGAVFPVGDVEHEQMAKRLAPIV